MKKVYIVQVYQKKHDRTDIVDITLEHENVRDIINKYLHYRVLDAEEYGTEHDVQCEKEAMTEIWNFYKNYDFESRNVGSTVSYGIPWFSVSVTVRTLYEDAMKLHLEE